MPEGQNNNEELSQVLEIYIDYERLKAGDMARLLNNLSFIANKIAEDYFTRIEENDGEDFPTLDIETMNTGGSIKFTLVEGWKVRVRTSKKGENADMVVSIPRVLGIPIALGYLLVQAVNGYLDYRIKQEDLGIKIIERQLKASELAKVLNSKSQEKSEVSTDRSVTHYLEHKVPEIKPVLLDTVRLIHQNPEISQFRVNGIELKKRTIEE